jgi:hypothetical protein
MFMYTHIDARLLLLQTVPASCVLGSSWADWKRIFAHTKYVLLVKFLNSFKVWLCEVFHNAIYLFGPCSYIIFILLVLRLGRMDLLST